MGLNYVYEYHSISVSSWQVFVYKYMYINHFCSNYVVITAAMSQKQILSISYTAAIAAVQW